MDLTNINTINIYNHMEYDNIRPITSVPTDCYRFITHYSRLTPSTWSVTFYTSAEPQYCTYKDMFCNNNCPERNKLNHTITTDKLITLLDYWYTLPTQWTKTSEHSLSVDIYPTRKDNA